MFFYNAHWYTACHHQKFFDNCLFQHFHKYNKIPGYKDLVTLQIVAYLMLSICILAMKLWMNTEMPFVGFTNKVIILHSSV